MPWIHRTAQTDVIGRAKHRVIDKAVTLQQCYFDKARVSASHANSRNEDFMLHPG